MMKVKWQSYKTMTKKVLIITYFILIIISCISLPNLYCQTGPYYVDDDTGNDTNSGTFTAPFKTIQKAVDVISGGVTSATCYIFPGTYNEDVVISSNKNSGYMVLTKLPASNSLPVLNGLSSDSFGIKVTNASKIIIKELIIKGYTNYGILITGATTNNYILNNSICSNKLNGISINSENAKNNYIISNNIFGGNQLHGIEIIDGNNNIIKFNEISHHSNAAFPLSGCGILLQDNAENNYIIHNNIYSNVYSGIVAGGINNYILTNNIWGENQTSSIYLCGKSNIIKSNWLHHTEYYGITITGSNNIIVKNTFYNNPFFGINLSSSGYNSILSNDFRGWGNSGLRIVGSNNYIKFNKIHYYQHGTYIFLNSCYNYIENNLIYSNSSSGIFIDGDSVDFNYIISNNIYDNKDGIFNRRGDKNEIKYNNIHHNESDGIYLTLNATENYIIKNIIYSNSMYGIQISSEDADNNYILTNTIWGSNQIAGIAITNGDNNKIYRNIIHTHKSNGIKINGDASNIKIINNTIFKSLNLSGVIWEDSATGIMYNNIILSNNSYGIQSGISNSVIVAYNDIYGNLLGPTNGNLLWGTGNLFKDPFIDTITSFTITSSNSPAIDTGTNIPGVSDIFKGFGPDMGWKEFPSKSIPNSQNPEPQIIIPEDVKVYPNYLNISGESKAKIVFGKPDYAEIKIYNIVGELVKYYPKQYYNVGDFVEWDGTIMGTKKKVGAGIYIIVVNGNNLNKKLKIIIKK